jgi:hypothetical protein
MTRTPDDWGALRGDQWPLVNERDLANSPYRRRAQGIEAAPAAETVKLGSVHESPVAKPCAQEGSA